LFSDFTKDVIVKADKNMISTILRNLLTNAIKFTPNGGSVSISCKNSNKLAKVSVTDTGVGMSEDELDRLFKVDGNLKNNGTNSEIGTGLGLILCQEFMNLHKSKILAESTTGKGSTFSFTLDVINLN
jgi:signal transduction histidine kinase